MPISRPAEDFIYKHIRGSFVPPYSIPQQNKCFNLNQEQMWAGKWSEVGLTWRGQLDKPQCLSSSTWMDSHMTWRTVLLSSGSQTYLNTKPQHCLPPPCCTDTLTSSSRRPVGSSPHTF
ncbi:hypothetical protein E3U43_022099 [Larimichthys crocea]|uniref:Uncharacterized protein n=1 Tax=Larimichthys crocea TaxID=215358 RepID=A0ACD3R7S8_LARCR|nr:hypothetical protein E3U43_022099 [Larimichthys crocea]